MLGSVEKRAVILFWIRNFPLNMKHEDPKLTAGYLHKWGNTERYQPIERVYRNQRLYYFKGEKMTENYVLEMC